MAALSEDTKSAAAGMTVTVCQLHDHGRLLNTDWAALVRHASDAGSDLVLLPAMPFAEALPVAERFDSRTWQKIVDRHDRWTDRLAELAPARVLGTRPIDIANARYEVGYVYAGRLLAAHSNSRGQQPWYRGAAPEFVPTPVGQISVGFLIGQEIWHAHESAPYGREQVDLLVTPRIHSEPHPDLWLKAARVAARRSGAVSLSSVHVNGHTPAVGGWVMLPNGDLLVQTSEEQPFVSIRIPICGRSLTPPLRSR